MNLPVLLKQQLVLYPQQHDQVRMLSDRVPAIDWPEGLMEGFELQDGPCALYQELEPKNTIQAIMAVLALNLFNASSTLSCRWLSGRNIPPHVRDIICGTWLQGIGHCGRSHREVPGDVRRKPKELQGGQRERGSRWAGHRRERAINSTAVGPTWGHNDLSPREEPKG